MTKNLFCSHISPFQINTQHIFFSPNGGRWPFWMSLSIRFLAISDQYAILIFFSTKWLPAAILDDRKSLLIPFLTISDQYTTLFWKFYKKWPPVAILEFRFAPKTIGFFHYVLSMAMPNMKLIGKFVTQL